MIDCHEMETFRKIVESHTHFLICGHVNPDGDCLSSTIAMALGIKTLGKTYTMYNQSPVHDDYRFLPHCHEVVNSAVVTDHDVVIVVDSGDIDRVGTLAMAISNTAHIINIDHHITNTAFGNTNIVYPEASCTGEIIWEIFKQYPITIDRHIATALYCAVLSDTGSFHYANASGKAFRMAGEMVDLGVNPWEIAEQLYENRSPNRLRLLSCALKTLDIRSGYASIFVNQAMFHDTKTSESDIDGFINFPRSIMGVEVAICFKELGNGQIKVSFRSKGKINVAEITQHLGGGGHSNAAGATLNGTLSEVTQTVYSHVEAAIQRVTNRPQTS